MYFKKILAWAGAVAAAWLGVKYLLPVLLPFLLGTAIAFAAEPLVRPLSVRLPRWAAAGLGVTAALLGIGGVLSLLGAVAVRELGNLVGEAPRLADMAQQGLTVLEDWMVSAAESAPDSVRPALQRTALEMFDDGSVLLQQVTQRLPGVVTSALGRVGSGVVAVGTGILSAFLISARLPRLRQLTREWIPQSWRETYLPALRRVRKALGGWLKAQLKLSAVTWGIVTVGFLFLRIPYGPAWAAVIAVVDAVPVLGTGTVLVPWALVSFLQGQSLQAVGLLCTYGAAAVTRTVLEPRLVGSQLGLDPLTTLIALYGGYRFWGIGGLFFAPILASAAKSLLTARQEQC